MAINRTGYSIGDIVKKRRGKYVVTSVKQRPRRIVTRRIVGNTIGKRRTFKI